MNVLSVLSPSMSAATTWPCRGSGPCSKITQSPSQMFLPIIESPRATRAKVRRVQVMPRASRSMGMAPSANGSRFSGKPAGIEPRIGTATTRLRNRLSGATRRRERALPGSRLKYPLRINAATWSATARGLRKPKCRRISSRLGQSLPAPNCSSMKVKIRRCLFVSSTITIQIDSISGGRCQARLVFRKMGSTGDSPVPVGDPPTGRTRRLYQEPRLYWLQVRCPFHPAHVPENPIEAVNNLCINSPCPPRSRASKNTKVQQVMLPTLCRCCGGPILRPESNQNANVCADCERLLEDDSALQAVADFQADPGERAAGPQGQAPPMGTSPADAGRQRDLTAQERQTSGTDAARGRTRSKP